MAGSERTAADVERARDALEKFYHDQGYPTVLVNIPEQSAEGGAIRLQVIESRISSTTVLGNRHFPTVQVLRALPSLAPGAVLYVPDVEREIGKLNRNPDLKVIPAMTAGKQLGTVEVELKVEDKSPFHGFLELNNRNSPNTSALRLNAGLHYDNLWSRGHSLSFQYQLSPEKPKEVEVFSGSYTLPAPWNADRTLVLYGVSSDSNTAFGEGFHTVGKGSIVGTRYVVPLASVGAYSHSAVLGVDYKNFREVTGSGAGGVTTPVEYLPFSLTYSGSRPDSGGLTLLNAGLNLSFRGAVAQQQGFQNKRYKSLGNYATATLGARAQQHGIARGAGHEQHGAPLPAAKAGIRSGAYRDFSLWQTAGEVDSDVFPGGDAQAGVPGGASGQCAQRKEQRGAFGSFWIMVCIHLFSPTELSPPPYSATVTSLLRCSKFWTSSGTPALGRPRDQVNGVGVRCSNASALGQG